MATASPGSLSEQALDIFMSCYGAETGVVGLKFMPFGGLYLTAGVTSRLLDRIKSPKSAFLEAYRDKGRVAPLLHRVPLYVITAKDCGERGAQLRAVYLLKGLGRRHEPHALTPDELVPPRETHVSQMYAPW